MKLSTKTRYALRAIISLTINQTTAPITINKIAEDIDVSKKYLESLLLNLKNANLVRSSRGINGGYYLAKKPSEITVYDVSKAVEGPIVIVECVNDKSICERGKECIARDLWEELNNAIINVMKKHNIKDMAKKELEIINKRKNG